MAEKKHPSKDVLKFKLSGKVAPGCRYAIVSWKPGNAARRDLASCHRKVKSARERLAVYREKKSKLGKFLMMKARNYAIFDLITGKRVKG